MDPLDLVENSLSEPKIKVLDFLDLLEMKMFDEFNLNSDLINDLLIFNESVFEKKELSSANESLNLPLYVGHYLKNR